MDSPQSQNNQPQVPIVYAYGGDRSSRKPFYQFCIRKFNLLSSMEETANYETNQLFCVNMEYMQLFFARRRSVVDAACTHAYNVNGVMPYFRGKHQIKGKTYHTALIDTRFFWSPNSPN